jgi:cytochrome P450
LRYSNKVGGGVDTTTSTMLSFILAAVAFPEAMKPAKDEIDKYVGSRRSPDFTDEPNLVYCKTLIKETLRWRSVAILGGLPHAPTKDDVYRGYLIPANTSIMVHPWRWLMQANIWAIHRHPREFPEADVFKPERYLENNRLPYPNERGYNTFGFGRRQCSGQPLAEQGLFSSVCRLLWAFDIKPALDEQVKSQLSTKAGQRNSCRYFRLYQWREYASAAFQSQVHSTKPRNLEDIGAGGARGRRETE